MNDKSENNKIKTFSKGQLVEIVPTWVRREREHWSNRNIPAPLYPQYTTRIAIFIHNLHKNPYNHVGQALVWDIAKEKYRKVYHIDLYPLLPK